MLLINYNYLYQMHKYLLDEKDKIDENFLFSKLFNKENFFIGDKSYKCYFDLNCSHNHLDILSFKLTAIKIKYKDEELLKLSKNHKLYLDIISHGNLSYILLQYILDYFKLKSIFNLSIKLNELVNIIIVAQKMLKLKLYT